MSLAAKRAILCTSVIQDTDFGIKMCYYQVVWLPTLVFTKGCTDMSHTAVSTF